MPESCLNCHQELREGEKFCSHCGQKKQKTILPIKDLLGDSLANVFNFDSRFFRTLAKLAVPGALTREWQDGRRVRYYSPFRIQLVSLIIMLAYLNLVYEDFTKIGDVFNSRATHHQLAVDSLNRRFSQIEPGLLRAFPELQQERMTAFKDSLLNRRKDTAWYNMNFQIMPSLKIHIGDKKDSSSVPNIPVEDIVYAPIEDIGKNLSDSSAGTWGRMLVRQFVKLLRSPSDFVSASVSNILWMVIFMMPVVALSLLLMYWRRGYYFIQHLVFLYHVSSFQVLALTIGLLGSQWLGATAITLGVAVGLLYHFAAHWRVYPGGFLQKIVKYSLFTTWEYVIACLAVVIYLLVSVALF